MTSQMAMSAEQVTAYEVEFLGALIHAASDNPQNPVKDEDQRRAWVAMECVEPQMFSERDLGKIYELVRDMFVEGKPIDPTSLSTAISTLEDDEGGEVAERYVASVLDAIFTSGQLEDRTEVVIREWRRRSFADLCSKAVQALRGSHGEDGGARLAGVMSMRLIELYAGSGRSKGSQYPSGEEVVEKLRSRALDPEETGVRFPWPKLEALCGPMIPGEVVGVTAYSNQGKSVFGANMFWALVRAGVPCIAFPTEMMFQWVERGVAAMAGVSQWRAEKRRWKGTEGEYELEKYLEELEQLKGKDNWRIVARADISPAEIVMAVRILRKKWPSRTVVFFVDHLHRLNYGGEKPDEKIGEATRMIRNLAQEDEGLIPVVMYQPKKPEGGKEPYGPIGGHRIRGHSEVWNELDIHLSPWRAVVETVVDQDDKTIMGTVKAKLNRAGLPLIKKPTQLMEGRKWDDEHFHTKIDKRRTGGVGPNVVLRFDALSGRIWEPVPEEEEQRMFGVD